jgi:dTDP-4-amino-4,6-dideoxygalactose transaminase
MAGAKPIYVDIDAGTYNVDANALESRLTTKTRAVIVQHTFGIPADMDAVLKVARRRGVAVIEDCCHTLASAFNGMKVGSFAEAAFYSHRWGKPIVLGAGGKAVVRGEQLCAEFRKVCASSQPTPSLKVVRIILEYLAHENLLPPSMFWLVRDIFRSLSRNGLVMPTFDEKELQGLMSDAGRRIPKLHWRWLTRHLTKLDADTRFRRTVASKYGAALKALGALTFDLDERFDPVFLRYPVLVDSKRVVLEKARKRRIELGDWFVSAVHPLSSVDDLRRIGYEAGSCPVAEAVSHSVITLPIDHRITPRYIQRTIAFLNELASEGLLSAPNSVQLRYA